jgi:hypothetical protein
MEVEETNVPMEVDNQATAAVETEVEYRVSVGLQSLFGRHAVPFVVSELAAQRGWTTVADFGSQTAQAVATACEALKGASFTAEEHEIVFAAVAEAAAATAATMFLERLKVPEIPLHLPHAPTTAVGQVVAEEIQANNVAIESMDRYGDLEALSPRISEIVDTATAAMGATDKEKLLRLMSTLDMVS